MRETCKVSIIWMPRRQVLKFLRRGFLHHQTHTLSLTSDLSVWFYLFYSLSFFGGQ
ncbi:unnamed protein product [Brassica oleracea var. botrytis]